MPRVVPTTVEEQQVQWNDSRAVVLIDNKVKEQTNNFKSQHPAIMLSWHHLEYRVKVKGTSTPTPKIYSSANLTDQNESSKRSHLLDLIKGKFQKNTKQIIHNMSGYVEPGTVLAIMGPSGSGMLFALLLFC